MHCIRLVELANKKANPWERLQNQQNRCSSGAAGQRLPVLPAPRASPASGRAASPSL